MFYLSVCSLTYDKQNPDSCLRTSESWYALNASDPDLNKCYCLAFCTIQFVKQIIVNAVISGLLSVTRRAIRNTLTRSICFLLVFFLQCGWFLLKRFLAICVETSCLLTRLHLTFRLDANSLKSFAQKCYSQNKFYSK